MNKPARAGVVIFAADPIRLAHFYQELGALAVTHEEDGLIVLQSESIQLVIHRLRSAHAGRSEERMPPKAREDTYLKLFLPVPSLADTRVRAEALGGKLASPSEEWQARGFRACEAVDPEGNVVQFRENAS